MPGLRNAAGGDRYARLNCARRPAVTVASFGDMLRVPGSRESLVAMHVPRAVSCQIVYSPLDAVRFAEQHPDRQVVFFAVGFETTVPATALAVQQADQLGLRQFLTAGVARPRAACHGDAGVESQIVPSKAFSPPATCAPSLATRATSNSSREYHLPVVVTGFEPVDLLMGILECVRQVGVTVRLEVVNCYSRSVAAAGQCAGTGDHGRDL